MKQTYKIFGTMLFAATMASSCVDTDELFYNVEKPQTIAEYEYLNDYAPLKEYVNRSSHPGFKVSAALGVDDFNKQETLFRLAKHNFDEVVAGNAMKMASCVDGDGNMNFDKVSNFVNNAEEAGISVFGHTLAWHSQQPEKWLENILADKTLPGSQNFFLKLKTPKAGDLSYSWQIYYVLPTPLVKGKSYKLTLRAKTENPFKMGFWPYKDGGSTQYLADPEIQSDWATYTWEFTASDDHTQLQWAIGFLNGELDIDDIELVESGSSTNLVENGDFNGEELNGWRKNGWHGDLSFVRGVEGAVQDREVEVERRCLQISSADKVSQNYDNQFWIMTNHTFEEGEAWEISFDCRADKDASSSTQVHKGAGDYLHYIGVGDVSFTKKWKTFSANGSFTSQQAGGRSIAFNLNDFAEANNYYIDNVSFKIGGVEMITNGTFDGTDVSNFISKELGNGKIVASRIIDKYTEIVSGNSIPLTDQERKDTLTWAMNKWIEGMMNATNGKVKAWDVVNEAISGGGNVEGFYELQHTSADTKNAFYWQDENKLGDIDYVRTAVAAARKYYKGDAADLKLFINDYNLESTWDDNKKVKSLVYWIGKWEADGVTKIDGIGTQMHISMVYGDSDRAKAENESRKSHIENMFRIMAASGKLCRVSELDLGVDTFDVAKNQFNGVKTEYIESLPIADRIKIEKAQADYYQWIIEKYFEIIPTAQQYGFCQWCLTDAPASSGWRGGEPVGLWNLNYQRKPAYAGWAEGLKK